MGWLQRIFGMGGPAPGRLRLAASSSFPRYVNGEAHYQDHLSALCGGHKPGGHAAVFDAVLVPEPENPHDGNAVRVEIRGGKVGYLAREDAAKYVAQLAKLSRPGEPAHVRAKVMGGEKRRGANGLFTVVLSFTWPLRDAASVSPRGSGSGRRP